MSIKSDKWIRRQSLENGMIEPFEPNQVKSVDGHKVISYGTSSYGYDIRCADDFKVFTNINSTIIDPKNFDESSFVTVSGKGYCIIPPNSFALARTVERLKIPRSVLTVCLGKSTYARCFSGDTKVALVDGTSPTFKELCDRYEKGEKSFYGYGYQDGYIKAQIMTAPRLVGVEETLIITLDNGYKIECTPDHKFVMRDGTEVEARNLQPKNSLMPLYRHNSHGYESIYNPFTRTWEVTHRSVKAMLERNGKPYCENHTHHIDENIRNNHPSNLEFISPSEHAKIHNKEKDLSLQAKKYWNGLSSEEKKAKMQNIHSESAIKKGIESRKKYYATESGKATLSNRSMEVWKNSSADRREKQREIMRSLKIRPEITEEIVRDALFEVGSIRGAARKLNCDRTVFRRFKNVINEFKLNNHQVKSIQAGNSQIPVYCLSAEFGNFALEAGVIVNNCGIIVNVTPFEPEWEGYVTLEFSNTTPLPAKIYANEGVAQVLFFESDEICDISYADRGGKYQGQEGVTLPKA
jgi:deoxycytidine triphosphate deaminase